MARITPQRREINKSYAMGQRRCHLCSCQLTYNPASTGASVPNSNATFEHLIPKSKGGTRVAINGIIVCNKCNHTRGPMDWVKWIEKLQPPKKEWLIAKYAAAVMHYQNENRKIKVDIDAIHFHINTLNVNL